MIMAKGIYIDPKKCVGCRTCELVCSIKNEGIVNPVLSRIQIVAHKYAGQRIPTICMQCEDPVCVSVCPVGALDRDESQGLVKHDKDKCLGCKLCFMACPFGGIGVDPHTGKIFKCELCDGEPTCVRFCEEQAITFEEPDVALLSKKTKSIENLSTLLEKYAVQHGSESS
jgi:Fe-S-cluster-containing dehydrogenase component